MIRLLLFKDHQGDLLGRLIKAVTRGQYVHAAILIDEHTNTIVESYWPRVRTRQLRNDELAGIDVFAVEGLTIEQDCQIKQYLGAALALREEYGWVGLLRFSPFLRAILGEGDKDGLERPAFCSQFAFEAIQSAGVRLLNAHSEVVNPEVLSYSPVLVLESPLSPV